MAHDVPSNHPIKSLFVILLCLIPTALMFIFLGINWNHYEGVNLFTGWGFSFSADTWGTWNWHPQSEIIFFSFASLAVLSFRLMPGPRDARKLMHVIFHTIAVIAAIFGLSAIAQFKKFSEQYSFWTIHSWVAVLSLGLYILNYFGGLILFALPFTPVSVRKATIGGHKAMGKLIFAGLICAVISGLMDKEMMVLTGDGIKSVTYPTPIPVPAPTPEVDDFGDAQQFLSRYNGALVVVGMVSLLLGWFVLHILGSPKSTDTDESDEVDNDTSASAPLYGGIASSTGGPAAREDSVNYHYTYNPDF